ncbi:histone deacetylase family protein [Persicimonas caeni]|nr:histone deacetylase [Persicimonas caeni]
MYRDMLQLYYSDLYTGAISEEARFPKSRYRKVREELDRRGLTGTDIAVEEARQARLDEVHLVHEPEYVRRFMENELDDKMVRKIGFRPWTEQFVDRTFSIAGGTLQAFEAVMGGAQFAGNLAGGTHHAYADRGEGFCVFNDLAICAVRALEEFGYERVAIVDCDVHQGNGTAVIFADEPRVLTYSIHCAGNYPFDKEESDVDVAVPVGSGDEAYLELLDRSLSRALYGFRPQLVLYQAGVDALEEDRWGRLALTRAGLRRRNGLVFDLAEAWACPVLITMGGGYSRPIEASVAAHADVFEEASRRLKSR